MKIVLAKVWLAVMFLFINFAFFKAVEQRGIGNPWCTLAAVYVGLILILGTVKAWSVLDVQSDDDV